MGTYCFKRAEEYLVDFDVAGVPQTTPHVNLALWIGLEDEDFDGYDIPARAAGFTAVEVRGEE